MSPTVSIIIPAYNRQEFVRDSIRSVLNQSRRDFELIVWDDGSNDDTLAIAKEASKGDPRVRVMHGENRGQLHAINSAAALATGEYLGTLDSDDMLAETALAETVAFLDARPEVGMVYTQYSLIDRDATVKGIGRRCSIPHSPDRLLVDFMTFHFRLMRRRVFDAVGGMDSQARFTEDYDLVRLSETTRIEHLARPLYYYRVHSGSESNVRRFEQIEASANAVRRALKRRKLDDKFELELEYQAKFYLKKKM